MWGGGGGDMSRFAGLLHAMVQVCVACVGGGDMSHFADLLHAMVQVMHHGWKGQVEPLRQQHGCASVGRVSRYPCALMYPLNMTCTSVNSVHGTLQLIRCIVQHFKFYKW